MCSSFVLLFAFVSHISLRFRFYLFMTTLFCSLLLFKTTRFVLTGRLSLVRCSFSDLQSASPNGPVSHFQCAHLAEPDLAAIPGIVLQAKHLLCDWWLEVCETVVSQWPINNEFEKMMLLHSNSLKFREFSRPVRRECDFTFAFSLTERL